MSTGLSSRATPLLNDSTEAEVSSRPLGSLAVLSIVFFNVCGSPIGSEGVIGAFGPTIGLASFVAFALLFSVPQAMITAELSTAFPQNGGYSIWVQAAWGRFWGVQQSYYSWFSGVVDSAIYPVLLYSCIENLLSGLSPAEKALNGTTCPVPSNGSGLVDSRLVDFPALDEVGSGAPGGGDDGEDLPNLLGCLLPLSTGCAQEYSIKVTDLGPNHA